MGDIIQPWDMPCFNVKVSSRDVEDPLLLGVLFRMDKSILVSSQYDTVSFSRIFFRAFSYLSVLIIKFESTAVVAEEWKGVPNCEYSICHKCLHDFYIIGIQPTLDVLSGKFQDFQKLLVQPKKVGRYCFYH